MVKLRQQFQEILQEAGLLPKGYDSRKWDHQSEGMRRELKQLRKQQRVEQRRRKILKMDDEGVRSLQGRFMIDSLTLYWNLHEEATLHQPP